MGEKFTGVVVCKVRGIDSSTEVAINCTEKLWLSDFESFAGRGDRLEDFSVGRSDEFLPNASQAQQTAIKNVTAGRQYSTNKGMRYLVNGRPYKLSDRLLQKYERPYGDVYRCAVLLEADKETVSFASVPVGAQAKAKMRAPSFEWFVALLIGLTLVIGTISNVLTQGYCHAEISNSVSAMVVLGVFVLFLIVIVSLVAV